MRHDSAGEHLRRHRRQWHTPQGARPPSSGPVLGAASSDEPRRSFPHPLECSIPLWSPDLWRIDTTPPLAAPVPARQEVAADLEAAGASEPVLTTIVAVWRAESPAFLKQLRGRQLGAPDVLHGVNWRIHVPMARAPDSSPRPRVRILAPYVPRERALHDSADSVSPSPRFHRQAGSSVDKEAPAELLGVLDLALGPPKAPGQARGRIAAGCFRSPRECASCHRKADERSPPSHRRTRRRSICWWSSLSSS